MPAEPDNVIHQLAVGDPAAVAAIVEQAHASDDVTTLVSAALFAPDSTDLLRRAAAVAKTTRDRQVVAIAVAHVAGDVDLVDALARDHLTDHPTSVLVAWITAAHPSEHDHPKGPDVSHTTAPQPAARHRSRRRTPIVPPLVAVAPDRPRLPALRPTSRTSSPDPSTRCPPPCSTASSPARGSAPHSGRCSATATSASAGSRPPRVGLGAGLAIGADVVSYRTDITSLAVMGAVTGLGRRHRPRRDPPRRQAHARLERGHRRAVRPRLDRHHRRRHRRQPAVGRCSAPSGASPLAFLQSTFIGRVRAAEAKARPDEEAS